MLADNNRKTLKTVVATVFIFFSIFHIIAVVLAYFEHKAKITNPLIPAQLLTGIRNFTIFIVLVYLLVIVANLFSIWKQRAFYTVQVASFMVLLCFQFFYPEIIDFFLNNQG